MRKIIIGIILIVVISFGVWKFINIPDPVIVLNQDIILEYDESGSLNFNELLPRIVNVEKSNYRKSDLEIRVSVDSITKRLSQSNAPIKVMSNSSSLVSVDSDSIEILTWEECSELIDKFDLTGLGGSYLLVNDKDRLVEYFTGRSIKEVFPSRGKRKGELLIRGKVRSFEYDVMDTKKPDLTGPASIETELGSVPNYRELFSSKVLIQGDANYFKAGTYQLRALTQDVGGNETELSFELIVHPLSTFEFKNEIFAYNDDPLRVEDVLELREGDSASLTNLTLNLETTLSISGSSLQFSDLHFDSAKACLDAYPQELTSEHVSVRCGKLRSSGYGMIIINGAGANQYYLKTPIKDKVSITLNGETRTFDLPYHRIR